MVPAWKLLYDRAIRSEPENLLQTTSLAMQAIFERLRLIGFVDLSVMGLRTREHRALCLALSDLFVLQTAFKARG